MKKTTKENKKIIFKFFYIIFFSLILGFLCGYFISSSLNYENSYYQANFTYSGNKDLNQMLNKEHLTQIKNTDLDKYGSINIDSLLKNNNLTLTKENDLYTIKTKTQFYDDFFFISKQTVGTRAKTYIKLSIINYVDNESEITFSNPQDIVELKNHFSPYLGGGIGLGGGIILSIIIISFSKFKKEDDIEDNITVFHTPFHKAYWEKPLSAFKDTKKMVTLAMLFALLLISKLFSLPSGFGNLGIGFGYLFLSIIALIYGPSISLIIGALSDIIGYFITPQQESFNFGYTIQACLAAFTYGICFYRTKITFSKILLARIIVGLGLNVILGSLLKCVFFVQQGLAHKEAFLATFKAYALLYSLPKNLIYLIPQSLVLYLVFKSTIPILCRFRYIDEKIKNSVSWF